MTIEQKILSRLKESGGSSQAVDIHLAVGGSIRAFSKAIDSLLADGSIVRGDDDHAMIVYQLTKNQP